MQKTINDLRLLSPLRLENNRTTTKASLRSASSVNQCNTAAGILSFVGGELHKLTPGNIGNATAT
jgi:hypothetical protein